jgi:beta-glucosidase
MAHHNLFLDETQPIEHRVTHLLEQMTLDEKLAQLVGLWVTDLTTSEREFDETKASEQLKDGIGQITRVGAASLLPPQLSVALANRIQKFLIENTRLGIPAIMHEEAGIGYMARGATSFPQSIGLASTWEPDLVQQMAEVIRVQMRRVGAHHALAPVMDVSRDPRWGRTEETFGEDPFLVTQMGVAYIKGLQSADLRQGVAATGKHFVAHGWPEGGRNWATVRVGEREMREIFMTPFKASIQHAHIATMMNAYHEMDGIPCGSSREIMVDLLRDELGFDGAVVSDYFTLRTLVNYHFVAKDATDAARMGLEAGIDLELPTADCYGQPLRDGLANGQIDMALVDQSVKRLLRLKFQLGLFENPYADENQVLEVFNTPQQRQLSRKIAQKSIVLLKNDQILPLSKSLKRLAVIGPSADSARLLQGDYHYPAHVEHISEAKQNDNAPNPNERKDLMNWDEHLPPSITVLAGIQSAVSAGTEVRYAKGCNINDDDTSGFAEAVAIAKDADVAVVVVGDKSGLGNTNTVGESVDKADLNLPGVQQALIECIYATGTPVILVLLIGRPYAITWADAHLPAILTAWLPAQEGGGAIADVLFGDVNPAGRLPISFPRSSGQLPVYYNHKPSSGRSHWKGQYVDNTVKPLYPFGHGLSYTEFEYRDLTLSQHQISPSENVYITVTVKNKGSVTGEEVVQLYVSDPVASVTRPVKMLKGFKRLTLAPDEERTIEFELDSRHLALYDRKMDYVLETGQIKVMVGRSSDDIQLEDTFEIIGATSLVEQVFFTPVNIK